MTLDGFDDEDTDPGQGTMVGPLLQPRAPASRRIHYAERYPPEIDAPVTVVLAPEGARDPLGKFLTEWDEYLDGKRAYADVPEVVYRAWLDRVCAQPDDDG